MNRYLSSAAALSIGFSCACFMDVLVLLLSPRHDTVLHLVGPASALFVPALVNIAGLALICFLLLAALWHFVLLRRIAMAGLTALLPWIVTKDSCYLLDVTIPHRVSMSLFVACLGLFCLLAFFPRSNHPALLRTRAALHLTYLFLAFVGGLFFAEAIYFGFAAANLNKLPPPTQALLTRTGNHSGRVIWLVLDELGYEQVYGHRLPSLQLPNFDRLRQQSTVFSQVQPAGIYTEVVLPSLMSGVPGAEISTSSDGRRLTLIEANHHPVPFQATDTVFSDALSLGYRNAVVGWYVPYCRLLHAVLSSCYWTGQTDLSPYFPARTIAPNLLHPLLRFIHKLPYFFVVPVGPTPDEIEEGKLHFADLTAITKATDEALANRNNDFILIHAPIPHPEGIWNRDTHAFDVNHSAYIDNLALADSFLGHIMTTLQSQGDWSNATIVLMGDHAWRTQLLWLHSRSWKPIDSLASNGGQFDPRPAYVVKLPNQQTPDTISTPFAATRTRALLDQLLRRTIATPAELQQFVQLQQPLAPPPPTEPTRPQNRAH